MNEDRLKHSYSVANKMVTLGKEKGLNENELNALFLLGYLHDIGYQFGDNEKHNILGGNLLKENNYKYWKEAYYHGKPNCKYKSLFLDILNTADMMIDKCGNEVGFDKRLEDIKDRYGEQSIQYINSVKIVSELKRQITMAIFCTINYICSYIETIPQIIKLIRTKSSNDYSLGMVTLQLKALISWSLYIFTSV